jgi:hypothetical protein
MGTPLTGSTVASTYTGLLKTADNASVTSSLKSISDGGGHDSALQVSTTAVNVAGNFTVATNKVTVDSATGNTAVAGTLTVTGATSLSSLSTSGNVTVGGNLGITGTVAFSGGITVPGTLSVTGASTLTGAVGMGSTLNVSGLSTLASANVTGAATVGTTLGVTGLSTLGSLTVTGASTLDSLGVTNAATVGGTLGVTGNTTLSGDLAVNGNTTIGNASGDSLTVTAGTVAINNLPSKTTPVDADTVLLRDSAASNALKTAAVSTLSVVKFTYSEDIVKTSTVGQVSAITSGTGTAIQQSGSTADWTYTWTPKTVGNKALIRISIPAQLTNDGYLYAGIVKSPYAAADVLGVGSCYGGNASPVNVGAEAVFTSTASSHTFKIWITVGSSQNVTIAANPNPSYFGQTGTTFQAKVHFELIEYT